jgi:hypothetical protein
MTYQQVRRGRRRGRRIALLVAVLVVLAVAYAFTRIQSDRQLRRQYLDSAMELADAAADVADELDGLMGTLEQLERPLLVEALDELQEEAARIDAELDELQVPGSLEVRTAHAYLDVATSSWDDGVGQTSRGMIDLTESPLDDDALRLVADGITALEVGDEAYAHFLISLENVDTSDLARAFPEVEFITDENEAFFDAADLGQRLFLTPSLGVVENLTVSDLRLDPGPIGEEEGVSVIPVSSRLDAEAIIGNNGTVEKLGIVVQLTLISGEGDMYQTEQSIPLLRPGQLTTVVFTDLPADAGTFYEVTVELTGTDSNSADDSMTFLFLRDTAE